MSNIKIRDIKSLIQNSVTGEFEILEEKTKTLTAPGEHYGSVMLAMDVTIKKTDNVNTETLNLVAKLIPANEMLRATFDVQITFRKEIFAYTIAIPSLIKFQKEQDICKDKMLDNFFPKCFGARPNLTHEENPVDNNGVLIFENLKLQGYQTQDRLVGFDLEAAKVVIQSLARFHAVPIALRHLKPKEFEKNIRPCIGPSKGFNDWPDHARLAFEKPIKQAILKSKELDPHLKQIKEAIDACKARPWAKRPPPEEPWGTMCHADFWTSNTMILRDKTGKVIRNKIVDLQMVKYWSCCADLVFFLFTSVISSVLDANFDALVKVYHETFLDTIKDYKGIDLDQFSFENFLPELKRAGKEELYHILFLLKPVCIEMSKVKNTAENFQDSDWTDEGLLGETHRKKVRDTLLEYIKLGWI